MIELELTIVRLKKTKEPVAIFDRVDCIFKLGFKTDEVANPAACEYADVEILCDFEVFFKSRFKSDCEEDEFFDKASFGFDMLSEAHDKFNSSDVEWCEFPEGFNYLQTSGEVEDRMLSKEVPF